MAHHRGLVITMLVVIVVFVVGTSTMAWATNDTDEPVEDDVAVDGTYGGRPNLNNYDSNWALTVIAASPLLARTITVTPTQSYACVDDEYGLKVPVTKVGPQPTVYVHLTIKSTGACAQDPSYAEYKVVVPGNVPDLTVRYGNDPPYAGNPLRARCWAGPGDMYRVCREPAGDGRNIQIMA